MTGHARWQVIFDDHFLSEFTAYPEAVRIRILARAGMLEWFGPSLGRPYADTLKGSAFANMKELRVPVGRDVWRVAYAFDARRRAVLLCAGNKRGNDGEFYAALIRSADARFAKYR